MPNVVRFTLPVARYLNVPGVGMFTAGVLDIDVNNLIRVSQARYRLKPYGAVEVGVVDSATPPPSLPAVPGPPSPDPYPQYVTDADLTNPASTASVTLRAALVPHLDLVSGLRAPFYISHRGGPLRFPEHSMEGYRASAEAGFAPEQDINITADGVPVCLHDGTVDRTMTGATGSVSSLTLAQWRAARIKPARPGFRTARPVTWDQVLTELGGRTLLLPEIKDSATTTAVVNSIVSRGLHRAVIVQSFNYANAKTAAQAGIATLWLTDSATATDLTNMLADKIEFLGCSTGASAAYIAAAKAKGLKVIVYTVNTASAASAAFANGADGIFTDDAWTIAGNASVPRDTDPFTEGVVWPEWAEGYGTASAVTNGAVLRGRELGLEFYRQTLLTPTYTNRQSWAGAERTGTLRLQGRLRFGPLATAVDRWGGIYLGAIPANETFRDAAVAGQAGYHFLIRRNGQMNIYLVAPGIGATSLVQAGPPGTPIAAVGASGVADFEIVIDDANVSITNRTNGLVATVANAAYRGPYALALSENSCEAAFSSLSFSGV